MKSYWLIINGFGQPLYSSGDKRIKIFMTKKAAEYVVKNESRFVKKTGRKRKIVKTALLFGN